MQPPIVISVHGIRTRGAWQKTLAQVLAKRAIPVKSVDYGYYRVDQMIRPWLNESLLDRFLKEYQEVRSEFQTVLDASDPLRRPSAVAHSMGTYIVAYAMQKYEEIKLDKLIMCGGILPIDFDWDTLFDRDQVNLVRNEYGLRDLPSRFAALAIRGAGPSGRFGFSHLSNRLTERQYTMHRHGDFFSPLHIEAAWLPFLQRTPPLYGITHGRDISTIDELARITDQTAQIDNSVFAGLPDYDKVKIDSDDNIFKDWVSVNPDIYTFLYDRATHAYCGYINAMPLTDDGIELLKTGKLRDNAVPASMVMPFLGRCNLKVYFMSIAVDPNRPKLGQGLYSTEFETLLRAWFAKLSHYARHQKIRVTEVFAVGWTITGRRICEQLFGMSKIGEDEFHKPIYKLDLTTAKHSKAGLYPPLRRLIRDYDELLDLS